MSALRIYNSLKRRSRGDSRMGIYQISPDAWRTLAFLFTVLGPVLMFMGATISEAPTLSAFRFPMAVTGVALTAIGGLLLYWVVKRPA